MYIVSYKEKRYPGFKEILLCKIILKEYKKRLCKPKEFIKAVFL